jgi:hypothetical protein
MAVLVLAMVAIGPALAGGEPYHEPNAVIINITEDDLNRMIRDLFHANGASTIEGGKEQLSRGLSDFRYRADFSEPVLRLGEDGQAQLDLEILQAELTIGSIERKLLKRRMHCRNAGVTLDEEHPVDVTLDLHFAIEQDDLQIVPEQVTLAGTKGFRLHKPERCNNNPLPEFLMWWIGKGRLRHKIDKLDDVLLKKAKDGATALNEDDGFLARHWSFDPADLPGNHESVHLYPQSIDTSHHSLLIGLAGSSPDPAPSTGIVPDWVAARAARSFLGLSESFLNFALATAFRELDGKPREPSGGLRKLFRSDAVYALIPGLRGLDTRDALRLGFTFHGPPAIDFTSTEEDRAVIGIHLADVEMTVWAAERWIGSVAVDAATVSVAPYFNRLGGISFDIVENDWQLSSRGIEFDEELLAATFQEMFFGEVFETRFEPVAEDGFAVGDTRFDPRYFSLVGKHLVIGLTGL